MNHTKAKVQKGDAAASFLVTLPFWSGLQASELPTTARLLSLTFVPEPPPKPPAPVLAPPPPPPPPPPPTPQVRVAFGAKLLPPDRSHPFKLLTKSDWRPESFVGRLKKHFNAVEKDHYMYQAMEVKPSVTFEEEPETKKGSRPARPRLGEISRPVLRDEEEFLTASERGGEPMTDADRAEEVEDWVEEKYHSSIQEEGSLRTFDDFRNWLLGVLPPTELPEEIEETGEDMPPLSPPDADRTLGPDGLPADEEEPEAHEDGGTGGENATDFSAPLVADNEQEESQSARPRMKRSDRLPQQPGKQPAAKPPAAGPPRPFPYLGPPRAGARSGRLNITLPPFTSLYTHNVKFFIALGFRPPQLGEMRERFYEDPSSVETFYQPQHPDIDFSLFGEDLGEEIEVGGEDEDADMVEIEEADDAEASDEEFLIYGLFNQSEVERTFTSWPLEAECDLLRGLHALAIDPEATWPATISFLLRFHPRTVRVSLRPYRTTPLEPEAMIQEFNLLFRQMRQTMGLKENFLEAHPLESLSSAAGYDISAPPADLLVIRNEGRAGVVALLELSLDPPVKAALGLKGTLIFDLSTAGAQTLRLKTPSGPRYGMFGDRHYGQQIPEDNDPDLFGFMGAGGGSGGTSIATGGAQTTDPFENHYPITLVVSGCGEARNYLEGLGYCAVFGVLKGKNETLYPGSSQGLQIRGNRQHITLKFYDSAMLPLLFPEAGTLHLNLEFDTPEAVRDALTQPHA